MNSKRADQILVDLGLAPSRSKAQELIDKQCVVYRTEGGAPWRPVISKAEKLPVEGIYFEIRDETLLRYVSRAGLKLEGALKHLNLAVGGLTCLDVGASTGGFTHCLLQKGAVHVDAVDVGHDQLDPRLRDDPRIQNYEGVNIKDLAAHPDFRGRRYDLIVVDVSFISLTKVLPSLQNFLKTQGAVLALVKPQFEVGAVNLDKRGVVKAGTDLQTFFQDIQTQARGLGWDVQPIFPSGTPGRDGNQEYFLYGRARKVDLT